MINLAKLVVLADLCTNHKGNISLAQTMIASILTKGALPKIQLFSGVTWPRTWTNLLLRDRPFVASIFRPSDIDYILPFNPQALKIASVEATYDRLIRLAMQTNLPVIVSTGGMTAKEFQALVEQGYENICYMHCVSQYPTQLQDVNLARLDAIQHLTSPAACGLSLHCPEFAAEICVAAYAMGATVFELHVRLGVPERRNSDSLCSVHLSTLAKLIISLEAAEKFMGNGFFVGADFEDVRKWRRRWQDYPQEDDGEV